MTVCTDTLRIIANDTRGLSADDRAQIHEAANNLEDVTQCYFRIRAEMSELERKLMAREERIKELTRPKCPPYDNVCVVSWRIHPVPSWARF